MAKITIEKDGVTITVEGDLDKITEAAKKIAESLIAAPWQVPYPVYPQPTCPQVPWTYTAGTGDVTVTWKSNDKT